MAKLCLIDPKSRKSFIDTGIGNTHEGATIGFTIPIEALKHWKSKTKKPTEFVGREVVEKLFKGMLNAIEIDVSVDDDFGKYEYRIVSTKIKREE